MRSADDGRDLLRVIEPMHVIIPTDVFPPVCGGAGWSTHALARALVERGHQVTAIVPRAKQFPARVGDQRPQRPIRNDVLGVPTVEVPYPVPRLPFVANWYRHEWLWPLLRNVIVREALRPGPGRVLLHAQHVQTVPGAVLAGRELQAPVVATVRDHWPRDYFATGLHGDRLPYPGNSATSLVTDLVAREGPLKGVLATVAIPYMLRHLRRRRTFLAQADAIVAVSHYMAGHLRPVVPADRIHVIPHVVDVASIQQVVAVPSAAPVERPFVLFVGKLEHNKGAHLLPVAMAAAREALGGAPLPPLVVAGSGRLAGELQEKFAAMGLGLRLLPGWTDHDEVLRLMGYAEVLLFPSAWGEPLTRVLLEASAAGACIAAMATGGTAEIVEDGISGVLATDAAELGRVLATLLRDPEQRARLREGARRIARERWAPGVVATRYEALYEQALRQKAVVRPLRYQ